jgi:putative transposase
MQVKYSQYLEEKGIRYYVHEEIQKFVKDTIEKLFESELTAHIGRNRYERKSGIKVYRNGHRNRQFLTKWCSIQKLRVPRLRSGNINFKLISENRIIEEDVVKMMIQIWIEGGSYRDIRRLVHKIYGMKLSVSSFSRSISTSLERYVESWKTRPVAKNYDCIYIDGLSISLKEFGYSEEYMVKRGKNAVVLLVLGQRKEGKRVIKEVLGYSIARTEDEQSYRELLKSIKQRGLTKDKIGLIVHDGANAIGAAIENVYNKAEVKQQLCLIHQRRNITARVRDKNNKEELNRDIWRVYSSPTRTQFYNRHNKVLKKWRNKEPEAMDLFKNISGKMLTKYYFDVQIHKQISSNNAIERYIREIRRRTKAIGCFETLKSANTLLFGIIEYLNQVGGAMPVFYNLEFTH